MKYVLKALPHATIVMSGMMIVFFAIDRVNTPMGFMTNEFHKWLSLMLAVSCMIYSVLTISAQRRRERTLAAAVARREAAKKARDKKEPEKTRPVQR